MIRPVDWLIALFLGAAVIVELTVVPRFPLLGQTPSLMLLLALAWGLEKGLETGVAWAFFAGILLDLFSIAPVGSTALAYMVAVAVVLLLKLWLPEGNALMPSLLTMVGVFTAMLAQFIILRLFGYAIRLPTIPDMLSRLAIHAALIIPFVRAVAFWQRLTQPRTIEI